LVAEPYIAVRTGLKCGVCHVNGTGGGKRTEFGVIYAQSNLYMKLIRASDRASFVDGKVSDVLSVGADFRVDNVSVFETESSEGVVGPSSNQSRVSKADLYVQMDLIPSVFTLYVDEILSPNTTNREFFGMFRDAGSNVLVKVGRMLLPFGLRLVDDDAFVRNRTGFTYSRHDLGVEVGLEPGPVSAVANVTDTRFSVVSSVAFRRFRIGGSYGRSTERSGQYVLGAFGGANIGRVTLLGEGDFITNGDVDRFAGLAELDFLAAQGLNVKATYEFFDRNRDVSNARDGQERITLGVEPFLTRFVQLGVFYRINRFIPQSLSENQDQLVVQFHGFF
jgi:hypothetical protein